MSREYTFPSDSDENEVERQALAIALALARGDVAAAVILLGNKEIPALDLVVQMAYWIVYQTQMRALAEHTQRALERRLNNPAQVEAIRRAAQDADLVDDVRSLLERLITEVATNQEPA